MSRKVLVSRQGLTECPGCASHVETKRETVLTSACPFCGQQLAAPKASSFSRLARSGRAGVLAAALLSAGSLAACDSDDGDGPGTAADTLQVQPYGIPADTLDPPTDTATAPDAAEDAATDTTAADGASPDAALGDVVVGDAVDAGPTPEYGIAPDMLAPDTADQ